MAVDPELLIRIRDTVLERAERASDVTERAMFGGVGFMLHGNMAVAASGQGGLMVRAGELADELVDTAAGVEPMTMRGRPMRNWLLVDASALAADQALDRWVDVGITFAETLPAK